MNRTYVKVRLVESALPCWIRAGDIRIVESFVYKGLERTQIVVEGGEERICFEPVRTVLRRIKAALE